jgi:hypothetical protein
MPPGKPGDRYSGACEWLFAAEMLQGEDPMWLDETLSCPKHGWDERRA